MPGVHPRSLLLLCSRQVPKAQWALAGSAAPSPSRWTRTPQPPLQTRLPFLPFLRHFKLSANTEEGKARTDFIFSQFIGLSDTRETAADTTARPPTRGQLWACKAGPGETSQPRRASLPGASCCCKTCQPDTRRSFSITSVAGLSLEDFPRCVRNNPKPGETVSCRCWFSQGQAQLWRAWALGGGGWGSVGCGL